MPVRAGTLVCLIGLAAIGLGAQSPTPSQDQSPKFRSDTRLVRISVIVHDRRGQPVDGLTAGDFRLFDRGTERTIALFDVERRTAAPDAVRPSAPGAPDARVFSNAIRGPAAGGVTVILFDRLNTAWSAQVQARANILEYLSQLKPTEPVAFYVLDSSVVHVVHDFTRDTSSLLRALARVRGRTSLEAAVATERRPEPSDSGDAATDVMIDAALYRTDAAIKGFYLSQRIEATVIALEAIARRLSGVQGRKNLIWVSSAFPLMFHDGLGQRRGERNVDTSVSRAARAMTDANVAVYPVDARGLIGTLTGPPGVVNPAFTTISTTMPAVDTMRTLAERTGGRAYYNTNDLGGAIARAVDDSQLLYVLGYYPPSDSWDGTFHEVKVTTRRPGLDIRHRTGYLALPSPPQDVETRQQALTRALNSPIDASGLPLTVTAEPGVGGALRLAMRIDTRALLFLADGDHGRASVDVAIALALSDGSLFRVLDTNVPLRFTREMRAQADREGLVLARQIDVRDDAHELRIAVRDPASGALGTVSIPAAQARAIAIPR
jgi:VWFA-related protein